MKYIALLLLLSGSAYAADYNHLVCKNIKPQDGLKTDCYVEPEVKFEGGVENAAQPFHTEYTIETNFDCPGNMMTSIVLRAGSANAGFRLKIGSKEVIKLYGVGPVTLEDTNNKSTSLMRLSLNCGLSFKVLEMKPSTGTVDTWIQLQKLQRAELSDLISIYQTRSTIAFWEKRVSEGDQTVIGVLTKMRDDTQKAVDANPLNFPLKFRLEKYNEILNLMPRDQILSTYRDIFTELQASVKRSNDLMDQLRTQNKEPEAELVKLVSDAQVIINKGFQP